MDLSRHKHISLANVEGKMGMNTSNYFEYFLKKKKTTKMFITQEMSQYISQIQ